MYSEGFLRLGTGAITASKSSSSFSCRTIASRHRTRATTGHADKCRHGTANEQLYVNLHCRADKCHHGTAIEQLNGSLHCVTVCLPLCTLLVHQCRYLRVLLLSLLLL